MAGEPVQTVYGICLHHARGGGGVLLCSRRFGSIRKSLRLIMHGTNTLVPTLSLLALRIARYPPRLYSTSTLLRKMLYIDDF